MHHSIFLLTIWTQLKDTDEKFKSVTCWIRSKTFSPTWILESQSSKGSVFWRIEILTHNIIRLEGVFETICSSTSFHEWEIGGQRSKVTHSVLHLVPQQIAKIWFWWQEWTDWNRKTCQRRSWRVQKGRKRGGKGCGPGPSVSPLASGSVWSEGGLIHHLMFRLFPLYHTAYP